MVLLEWCALDYGILNGVSGRCYSGQLHALMGPSGSGKTTMLESIYRCSEFGQHVTLNDKPLTKKDVSYVFQQEQFIETLTVYETLEFTCRLRKRPKEDMLSIISKVRFESLLDQRVSALSGGEKKRLEIAVELANMSPVFLLDEPTTSLDSHLASSIVEVLHDIKDTMCIICTIHQPSLEVFMGFDAVTFLHNGSVCYSGNPSSIVDYCVSKGLKCPMYTNPAEFFIQSISQGSLSGDYQHTGSHDVSFTLGSLEGACTVESSKVGLAYEYFLLLKRSYRDAYRQPIVTQSRVFQSIIFGMIVGTLFFNLGTSQTDIQNKNGCIFFILVNQMMSVFFSVVQTFPLQLKTFKQEHDKRLYRIGPYYWAKTTADIPVQLFVICTFSAIVLPMTSVCPSPQRALMFLGYLLLTSTVFSSFGYFVSTLANDPVVVLILGNILILPAMLVGGFFINNNSVPNYYVVLETLSTFNYAFQALVRCVYHDTDVMCTEEETRLDLCAYDTGDDIMVYLGAEMGYADYVYILLAQSIILRTFGHIVLYSRFKAIPFCKNYAGVLLRIINGAIAFKTYILR